MMEPRHIPVLVEEVMNCLGCQPHQTYVDATLGGGGHALEILNRTSPDGKLIGMDWDEEAILEAGKRLVPFGERVTLLRENFIRLPQLLEKMNIPCVDGILLDLGLSSMHIDQKERGFSFVGEAPLDMRMDQRRNQTAADLLNRLSAAELERILLDYGEERWARRIAQSVILERGRGPILTTEALRRIIQRAVPKRFQSHRIDPSTRTFQALRIAVNEELSNLREFLHSGWKLLKKGGRLCIISFHSLEDRMVKTAFRSLGKGGGEPASEEPVLRVLTKKPVIPSEEERIRNPRSRSAKMRCAERL